MVGGVEVEIKVNVYFYWYDSCKAIMPDLRAAAMFLVITTDPWAVLVYGHLLAYSLICVMVGVF